MVIRKASDNDISDIEKIYNGIHSEEEKGLASTGWIRGIYPTEESALAALKRNDLFVLEDNGEIVASAVINQIQVEEYKFVKWSHDAKDSEIMVLHCLAVDTIKKNRGYAKAFLAFYENYAKEHNCTVLRMDTNIINTPARRLYKKSGYKETGTVKCTFNGIANVQLVCLEKYLG